MYDHRKTLQNEQRRRRREAEPEVQLTLEQLQEQKRKQRLEELRREREAILTHYENNKLANSYIFNDK